MRVLLRSSSSLFLPDSISACSPVVVSRENRVWGGGGVRASNSLNSLSLHTGWAFLGTGYWADEAEAPQPRVDLPDYHCCVVFRGSKYSYTHYKSGIPEAIVEREEAGFKVDSI